MAIEEHSHLLARDPRRILKYCKLYNLSIQLCMSCTLHNVVPQPGRLLQQPHIANIRVTTPG